MITFCRFIKDESIVSDLRRFFAPIHFVGEMEKSERELLYLEIKKDVDKFIVKPQKEGGSNNFSGKQLLKALDNEEIMNTSIIQAKINPPEFDAFILKEDKVTKEKCVSEFGIYGIIISDDTTVHLNKSAGFLCRTKKSSVSEGGVCSGYSVIDTPYLVG